MKTLIFAVIVTILSAAFNTHAEDLKSQNYDRQTARFEYENQIYKISKIIRNHAGYMIRTDQSLPQDTKEADIFFLSSCRDQPFIRDLRRQVTINNSLLSTQFVFQCDVNQSIDNSPQTVQFTVTLNQNNELKDLQIHTLAAAPTESNDKSISVRKGVDLLVEVAAATLASGILAKKIYTGEHDKFLHATVGSLIASCVSIFAYYRFDLTRNQAALVGFVTTIAVALLKEYGYDAHHQDIHTVDPRDASATIFGGAIGTLFFNFQFNF